MQLHSPELKSERYIHRIVAEAFIGPPPDGLDVCHKDDVKSNNSVNNLKYGTRKENMGDFKVNGVHWESKKESCPRGHRLVDPNLVAYKMKREGKRCCLSCERTRSRRKKYDPGMSEQEFQEISDAKYRKIMEN